MARNPFINGISDFFGDVRRARRAALAFQDLNELTDGELASRGLSRNQLARHAYTTGFGRK